MSPFPAHRRSLRRAAVATALIAAAAGALVAVALPAPANATAATMAGRTGESGWLPVASPPAPPANDASAISALAPAGPESAWAVGANQYTPGSGYPTLRASFMPPKAVRDLRDHIPVGSRRQGISLVSSTGTELAGVIVVIAGS